MHSKFQFYYLSWITMTRSVAFFIASLLAFTAIGRWLSGKRALAIPITTAAIVFFGWNTIRSSRSISYSAYKWAPFYSAFWIRCCLEANLAECLIGNLVCLLAFALG